MQALFTSIFDFFEKHRRLYLLCFVLVFVLSLIGASRIRFVEDISQMIPQDPEVAAMNDVLHQTRTGEQVIFTLSFRDSSYHNPDSLIVLQQSLQAALTDGSADYIRSISAVVNEDKEQEMAAVILRHLPVFLTAEDYRQIQRLSGEPAIQHAMAQARQLLLSPAGVVAKQWLPADPIGMVPLAFQKLQAQHTDPNYELYNGYILSKDLRKLTFFIDLMHPASETGHNAVFGAQLEHLQQEWHKTYPQLQIRYFGGPLVAAGNAVQLRQDTLLTLSITIILLLSLTYYVFRRKRAPFLIMIPVVFGALSGLAITALVQGSISIIALGAGALILGIAIDFSIHFLSHARQHPDMRENVRTLAGPLTLGALTTIAAFLALRFAHAPLLQDMGLFAGASLAGASLFTLIFLPHLLKHRRQAPKPIPPTFIDRLAHYQPERSKLLLLLVVLATPVLWYFAQKVEFDSDLMHLNYLSPQLKEAQEALTRDNAYALSSVFVVAKDAQKEKAGAQLEKIQPIINRLQEEGKIRNSSNPLALLPTEATQRQRIQQWKDFWTPQRQQQVRHAVQQAALAQGFSPDAFTAFDYTLSQEYTLLDPEAVALLQQLLPQALAQKDGLHYAIATLKVAPGARAAVLDAFQSQAGVVATDRQSVSEHLLDLLQRDFNKILLVSGLLVFIALLVAYGRIELALISFLPMALTWIWILGLMSLLGLQFNIVNIIIATLIFGLGDDYSIFMMDSLMEKYRTGTHRLRSARSAVYLSVLTTIIGLGTLILARHPALQSIALIAILGLVCVVFVSQVLQPFLFNFMIQHRADKGLMPFTLWSLCKSVFAFLYFVTGCLILTLTGIFLIGLRPLGRERSKYLFHYLLSRYTRSVIYIMTNLRKRVIKMDPGVFRKPAVYIANHSSFLDILFTTMLHPRLVLLTNKWVWRSPVFGKIVRMAEYYPVAEGAEDSLEPLRDLVRRGYGIVIFPEGTRSYDDTLHRFRKGAFYIAEQLQLDIVPILMHGVSYAMQKGDWLLKDGQVTLKLLPPIHPEDPAFGSGYSERTKKISRWFREQYQQEKVRNETPAYFREQLIKSYIYKGPVLEWYCRIKTRLEKNYAPFHALLPRQGLFYDLGCGYGFMTHMLHWAAPDRQFIGVDYDAEKIITARHNYTHIRRSGPVAAQAPQASTAIRFETADVTAYTLQPCQGIILSDVLHYLLPDQQEALLQRCYEALTPRGLLILRDGVSELNQRHKGTQLTEVFSTRLIGFNKTRNPLHFISRRFVEDWARDKGMSLEVLDHSKRTSNLIFVLRKGE